MKNLKILVASMVLTATSAVFAGQEISGKQLMLKDSTVGVSGLWNWIAANDKLDIGTEMVPDSGTSPLFAKEDGSIFAEATMKIGPEPEWTPEAADTLKYPFAYIEMRFKKDECVQNSSCGVNLAALGIKYIHIRSKVSGPIRMSVLNERTTESGAEPGVLIPNSTEYMSTQYDLTPFEYGFKGFDDHNNGGVPKWINYHKTPEGSEIIKQVTGLRWEISDSHGASGTISIESIEFIDGLGNVIDAFNITGMEGVRTNINDPLYNEIANGKQQALKDSTVGVSGLWNWIAANDKLDIGTEMVPDSGTSPLFAKEDGSIFAEAAMKIGPEPEWTQEAADADTLKYPFAYIEMRFKKDECVQDSSCGVDISALGVKYIRITSKVSGPIRMSVLNEKTAEPGTEPGVLILNSSEYKPLQYDLTPFEYGFKGFNDNNSGGVPKWTNYDKAPLGSEILKHATGLRWEISDSHGASGAISIKSIEFIDGSGNVIDAFNITGMEGVRSVIALESSSSSVKPESSSSSAELESSSSSAEPESSSSSAELESSSSEEPESSSSVEAKSSSSKKSKSSSSVAPKSSSSKKVKSSSSVAPKSSSSKKSKSSSSVEAKSSSSKKSKSSSSVKAKSSSSKKSKSSSSAAPKSSSSSSKKKTALPQKHFASMAHITVSGKQILISNATPGSDYAVFTMQGKVIKAGKIQNRVENITLENQGAFLVRVGHEIFKVK
ncbi:MAG: hypothetical protein J6T62_11090 [Fibrobacter sp.]|nr:hypothetical protein [Fibrobacter sp.]